MTKILSFLLPVILFVMGIQVTRDYFGGGSQEKRSNLEQLVAQGEETIGFLKNEYTEKTVKIARIPVTTYEVGYTFQVDGKEYSGLKTLNDPPTEPTISVKYLPSDPMVNAASPEAELASLDEYEGGTSTLLIGLGLILAGLGLGFYRFKAMQKGKSA
ncbi:MAG: hypothetical protein ACRBG0_00010 [Lewinella sp.]|jgi:hypothetical protein|uniref:hypothetical protein n=1 Tax=Lewinella sp. TaxID=2004506 RepID=UPI003D6A8620